VYKNPQVYIRIDGYILGRDSSVRVAQEMKKSTQRDTERYEFQLCKKSLGPGFMSVFKA